MEEYNGFCKEGRDGWFAKDKRYMLSMEEGPYYAIQAELPEKMRLKR